MVKLKRPQSATSPVILLFFVGESEDRPLPPRRQQSQINVVNQGIQSRQAPTPAASQPMATTTSRPATTQVQPQCNRQITTTTITSGAVALQGQIQNIVAGSGAGVSHAIPLQASQVVPVPIQLEWGLPGPDQIQSAGINSWISQVRNAYIGGHASALLTLVLPWQITLIMHGHNGHDEGKF